MSVFSSVLLGLIRILVVVPDSNNLRVVLCFDWIVGRVLVRPTDAQLFISILGCDQNGDWLLQDIAVLFAVEFFAGSSLLEFAESYAQ